MKKIVFLDSAHDDLRDFPLVPRHEAGYQLWLVQTGQTPDDCKPMQSVGQGVYEIRIAVENGAFRVLYVAKFEEAVYVLHCFQKKTQQTRKADIDLANKRYRELVADRRKK